MIFYKYKLLGAMVFLGVFISGCGGGGTSPSAGGNGRPTDTNISFKLFPDNYFVDYDVSANLSGSDNKGNTYTGNITEKTLSKTTFLSNSAVPIETKINLAASNGGFAAVTQSQYYGTNANDRRFLGVDGDVTTVSATTFTIPTTAKIGDSGKAGVYTDNSASISTLTWKLEDGFNGKAKLIFLTETNDQLGTLDNTFSTTYLINPDGERVSIELKTFNVNVDLEVTLTGDY